MKILLRLVVILIIGAGLAIGIIVYKQAEHARKGEAVLAEFLSHLDVIQADSAAQQYIRGLARRFHEEAFDAAVKGRSLFSGGVVDVNLYQRTAIERMIAHAAADGSPDTAEVLRAFREAAPLDLGG